MAPSRNEQSHPRLFRQFRLSREGSPISRMQFWGPLSALLLLLPLSWAREPAKPMETPRRSPDGAIAQQTEDAGQETTLVFPDYVDGGGWSVQLALSNVDPDAAAQVQFEVYDQTGRSVADLFDAESAAEIPPMGSRVWRSAGESEIRRGWIEVRTGPAAVSGLLTYRDTRSGIEVGVNPVELGQQFVLYVEESPAVGSGVAIYKREKAAGVRLRIRDEEGYDPLGGEFVRWGDFRQGARTLPEWIGVDHVDTAFLEDFRGLLFLETENDSPLIPLGLRFGKETSSLSAVPVIANPNPELEETALVFPDYVDGGGWSVQLVLSNVDAALGAEAAVEVYDQEGRVVSDLFDTESEVEIPSLGSRVWRSTGEGAIRRGWIEVRTDSAAVSGLLTYQDARSGIEVGVNPVELGQRFALFVEESPTVGSGVAIFKREAASSVELRLRDEEGNDPLEGGSVRWKDFRQAARTLPEWFDVDSVDARFLEDFRGLLLVDTEEESGLTPLGLRFGKRTSSLSAVPPIRIADEEEIDEGPASAPTVTLSASQTRIDWGQRATLRWSSTNAESVTIEPDIGVVSPSGSRSVSPRRTTTYRITARGADGETATATVTVRVRVSERAALRALYENLGGPDWTHSENWGTGAPLEDWYGVEVDDQGRVTGLRLVHRTTEGPSSGIGLTGEIPLELGALTHLRILDLSRNELTGEIPAQLGNLSGLTILSLNDNLLTGPIPAQLGNLSRLTNLYLNGNALMGPVPWQLGNLSQLTALNLSGNELTGPVPRQLGNLSQLTHMYLYNNELTGPIPVQLGRLSRLTILSLNNNELTGPIPAQLGNLSQLTHMYLFDNELTGPIPAQLGNLSQLTHMYLYNNELTGPIPPSFGQLELLSGFWFSANAGLCAPGTTDFYAWLEGIEQHGGPFCNESDVAVIKSLYKATSGADWTNSDGWLGEDAVSEWYGVQSDFLGRVTGLDLSGNGLEGRVPSNLAQLSQMIELRIGGNALAGRLPFGLARLPLQALHYADTELCAPVEARFQAWLDTVASHDGTGVECAPTTDRDLLVELYDAAGGPNWARRENWLTDAPLGDWSGVEVDGDGRVTKLDLSRNGLTGEIPLELRNLSQLTYLDLNDNQLTGEIPAQLGNLSQLKWLALAFNQLTGPIPAQLGSLSQLIVLQLFHNELTGPIPAQLGNLSQLEDLVLHENRLTGPIPARLGSLSQLTHLILGDNELTGPIPAQLGNLSRLETLDLAANDLRGPIPAQLGNLFHLEILDLAGNKLRGAIPAQLGGLAQLRTLSVTGNAGLYGVVTDQLRGLGRLEVLLAGDTRLCAPSDASSQNWLKRAWTRRVAPCSRDRLPQAYLTQAVQSREFPVPLVAGEKALLRVFVTASEGRGGSVPPVRARFYVRGRERYVLDIPGKSAPVPAEVNEGSLSITVNAEVPGEIVQPGLEMLIEVDPERPLGSGSGLARRIPETGRQAVEVRSMPNFDLTLIPFLWRSAPDRSIVELVNAMAKDPENHELLWATRTLLPIADLEVKAHEPVWSSSNDPDVLLAESQAIRAMEGARGYYMGMMPLTMEVGVALRPGTVTFSVPAATLMAHEFGHNLSLSHASCGTSDQLDPSFPDARGSIGVWGYDFGDGGRLVPPGRPDVMSYCAPPWISDYHFTNMLRFRLHTAAGGGLSSLVAAPGRSLLLWGGVDAAGTPFLEPAFVVKAPASLPHSTGEYRIMGRNDDGGELFSLTFEMPEVADGDGGSSFAFVLPVLPAWTDRLAVITLTGPVGSVTLDQDSDRPVSILRNPRTGQIRGILRGSEATGLARGYTVSALTREPDMEVLTSRGIPDREDWGR